MKDLVDFAGYSQRIHLNVTTSIFSLPPTNQTVTKISFENPRFLDPDLLVDEYVQSRMCETPFTPKMSLSPFRKSHLAAVIDYGVAV